MSKENLADLNPRSHVPYSTLISILSSRELSKNWLKQLENAYSKSPTPEVEKNILLTVALYVHHGNTQDSGSEIKRLMALYRSVDQRNKSERHQEISIADIAQGYTEGISNWFEEKFSAGDMNLTASQARGDPMLSMLHAPESIRKTVKTLVNTGSMVMKNPEIVPDTLFALAKHTLDGMQAKSNQLIIETVTADNPSRLMGTMLGSMAPELALAITDLANPAAKAEKTAVLAESVIDAAEHYHHEILALANLMGHGAVPPKPKTMRDFSDWMQFSKSLSIDKSWVNYRIDPTVNNGIESKLTNGKLNFTIYAIDHKKEYGRGAETFMSMVKKYQVNGENITQINADWSGNASLRTNRDQFTAALSNNHPEIAAKKTFTGEMASRLALTQVNFPLTQVNFPDGYLNPVFTHPDWGAGKQMNEYSLNFARAHGRGQIDTTPRLLNSKGEPQAPINPELLEYVYALPLDQRRTVLDRMHQNYETQEARILEAIHDHLQNLGHYR